MSAIKKYSWETTCSLSLSHFSSVTSSSSSGVALPFPLFTEMFVAWEVLGGDSLDEVPEDDVFVMGVLGVGGVKCLRR